MTSFYSKIYKIFYKVLYVLVRFYNKNQKPHQYTETLPSKPSTIQSKFHTKKKKLHLLHTLHKFNLCQKKKSLFVMDLEISQKSKPRKINKNEAISVNIDEKNKFAFGVWQKTSHSDRSICNQRKANNKKKSIIFTSIIYGIIFHFCYYVFLDVN
jgi:hypothetical protein